MTTEMNNQENGNMKQTSTSKEQQGSAWQGIAASSVGAMAGVVVGSMAQDVIAAEISEPEVIPATLTQPAQEPEIPQEPEEPAKPTEEPKPQNNEVEPSPSGNMTVLAYETVTAGNGQQMDLASIIVDNEVAVVVDIDRDGIADAMVMDVNGDGEFTVDEAADISDLGISMDLLAAAAGEDPAQSNGSLVAENGMSDYTNDADVTNYIG